MSNPLCSSVAMPQAKKLICRRNDRSPPLSPIAPPRMSGMMYRSMDRICCSSRMMDGGGAVLLDFLVPAF